MVEHHYTECGLDNVYIEGVEPVIDDAGEKVHRIEKINGLHKAIALSIIDHENSMSGKELRFLRTEIGLTQAELAKLLHREGLTVGRWERGEVPIDDHAEALIRLMTINKLRLKPRVTAEEIIARCVPTAGVQLNRIDGRDPANYRPIQAAA